MANISQIFYFIMSYEIVTLSMVHISIILLCCKAAISLLHTLKSSKESFYSELCYQTNFDFKGLMQYILVKVYGFYRYLIKHCHNRIFLRTSLIFQCDSLKKGHLVFEFVQIKLSLLNHHFVCVYTKQLILKSNLDLVDFTTSYVLFLHIFKCVFYYCQPLLEALTLRSLMSTP